MKNAAIGIRIEPFEKKAFARAARASGLSFSVWMRTRLRWAAVKDLPGLRSILDPAATKELIRAGTVRSSGEALLR